MPSWPASLPQKIRLAGQSGTFGSGVLRTQMDAGPAKQRRRYTATEKPFSGSVVLTGAQWSTLHSFWESDLSGGSLAFDWTHPVTGAAASVRFVSPPSWEAVDGFYVVNLSCEVMP